MNPGLRKEMLLKLEREVSLMGARLLSAGPASREEALDIARTFLSWTRVAVQGCGAWAREAQVLSEKILLGLEGGRPVDQALERLSTALTEASQNLEAEMLETPAPEAPSQGPAHGGDAVEGEYFTLKGDDAAGFQDFIAEAPEHLEAIERNLLSLSKGGAWDVLQVYRAFHTLKGICGFMNLPKMAALAHQAEARLEPFKQGAGRPSEDQVDWLLQACDLVREQVRAISQGLPSGRFRVHSFERLLAAEGPASPQAAPTPMLPPSGAEKGISHPESAAAHAGDASIRIGIEKMDALLEMVGELAISQAQVSAGVEGLGVTGRLASESSRLGKITRQLQDIVLALRMVPVEPLFLRMTRLARDLSRKTGKPLVLDLSGGDTEIDRRMVEELVEPLVHLIRNAVDHGLEAPAERARLGKSAEAHLKLSARHQGGDFILELSDDGQGLDFIKLEKRAKAIGFLAAGETADRDQLVELIFRPGFSTAETVTEVSGRGVGLDAVKRKVQSLKGSIHVDSEKGRGTAFRLRIPLTLALMDGVLVRVGGARYILPASQVQGFLSAESTEEHSLGGGAPWLATRQGHLPLIDLEAGLGSRRDGLLRPVVVEVEAAGRRACLMVDEILGKQQVVLKELGEGLHSLKGVTGGAILGDGRVGLILDMEALISRSEGPSRN